MEKITWLEGLETEDMINIVKSKFPKKNIWMEFGTIWADDLSETEALDLGVMLTGLTACEVRQLWEESITIEQADTLLDKLFGRSNGKTRYTRLTSRRSNGKS